MTRTSRTITLLLLMAMLSAVTPRNPTSSLAAPAQPPRTAAIGPAATPNFVTSLTLPESDDSKFPDIASFGSVVHMVGNPSEQVGYWTKTDSATNVSPREVIGSASTDGRKPDYAPAAVTTGTDGTIYVAWISQGQGIFMRKKPSGGSWGSIITALNSGTFRAYIDIGVTTDGQIFISWNQDSRFQYVRSTNGGASWSAPAEVSSRQAANRPNIATGPNGSIFITYGSSGHVYASFWQGSGFATEDVTPGTSVFNADPSGTFGTDGTPYVAWRVVGGGIYYAQRQSNGSWPAAKLADGEAFGIVQIDADPLNDLHMFWTSNISGGWDMWYAFKPASGAWQGPISGAGNATVLSNPSGTSTVSDMAYGHAVAERFTGTGMATRYYLFSAVGAQGPSAQPVIEGNAAYTNKTTMSVAFTNVVGDPTSVRWKWNGPPTDQDNDSGGWQSFSSTISVTAPSVGTNVCKTLTLYTQVSNANFPSPTTSAQDSIIFDNGVQAAIAALNPHMTSLPSYYTADQPEDLISQGGSSDGAASYTRDHLFFLYIADRNECAGLKDFSVPGSFPTTAIPAGGYQASIALPGDLSAGAKPVSVIVTDNLGNSTTYSTTLYYDPPDSNPDPTSNNTDGLPVLAAGATLAAGGTTKGIVRTLSFNNVSVTDNYYGQQGEGLPPGQQFWGVWIANSRTNVDPSDTSLRWYPVPVASPSSSFSIDWSLFTGLNYGPTGGHDGTYYLYARVLDGAGNPSARTITTTTTLDSGYALPILALPILQR